MRQAPIGGYRDSPPQRAPRHRFGIAEIRRNTSRRVEAQGARNPSGKPRAAIATQMVKRKPVWPPRMRRRGIYGDNFKVGTSPQPQHEIVRAHQGMRSTGLWLHAERLSHEFRAYGKRGRYHHEMIELGAHHPLRLSRK